MFGDCSNLPIGIETRKAKTRTVFILEGSITPPNSACKTLWCSLTVYQLVFVTVQ